MGEGSTPLEPAKRLGTELGLSNLLLKKESINPTGSFKARGMAVAVSRAVELGAIDLVAPSAGNAGGALAAYAAASGVSATVVMPSDSPAVNQAEVMIAGGVESMTRAPWVMPNPDGTFPRGPQTVYDTALGWRLKSSAAGKGGVVAAVFASPEGHPVELALRPVTMDGFAAGEITGLRVDAVSDGHTCRVHALRDEADNGHVTVEGEIRGRPFPRLVLPMPAKADDAVLSRMLVEARSDDAYPRALQLGAEILRSARS